jgi:phosphatidylglycerophosphatase A
MNSLKFWIAVGLGTGLSPKAPGTTGTLGILPLVVLAWDAPVWVWILVFLILVTLSLWSIPEAGRRLGEIDHGQIVIDEWAGMWLAGFGVAMITDAPVFIGISVAFLGFRFFDILKPWPVSWCEQRIPDAWGVLADDLAAGLYVHLLVAVFVMINMLTG